MGKNKFYQPEISFLKQQLPPPNFKSFNKALNKKILFPFPLAGMKNSLKKHFQLTVKLFSQPGISDKWKKLFFTSQKNSFYQEQRSFSLKIGLHVWIMVSIRKNQIFKKITFFLVKEIKENPILKTILNPANRNGFQGFLSASGNHY